MSVRGDNNKKGTLGQGASNQSNQAFGQTADRKSNHEEQTGGRSSEPQHKTRNQESDRNKSEKRI